MLASAGVVLLGLTGVAAFGIAPDTVVDPVPATLTVRDLPLPAIADAAAPGPQVPFWREERVIDAADEAASRARLAIVDALRALIARSLALLGIRAPEAM